MYDNTILSNQGTYQFAADSDILYGSAAPNSFVNTATGVVKMTANTGTSSIEVPFDNQGGTVDAESGTLDWTDGGTNTGGTYIANGTGVVDLTGGKSPTFTGTYTGSGTGRVQLASGTLAVGTGGADLQLPQRPVRLLRRHAHRHAEQCQHRLHHASPAARWAAR